MSLVSSAGLAARRELPRGLWVALAIAALAAVGVLALAIGPVAIPLGEIPQLIWSRFDADLAAGLDPIRRAVLLDIRLPRLVLALLTGAGLGVCGAALQALFRNSLADPGLIGVSSGGTLGAVIAISIGPAVLPLLPGVLRPVLTPGLAFLGSLLAMIVVWLIASSRQGTSAPVLLLGGIVIGALCGSASGILTYLSDDAQLRTITFWTMGSLALGDWSMILPAAAVMIPVAAGICLLSRPLDLLLLGEREAWYAGVNVQRLKQVLVIGVALAVGAGVAVTGLIAFVGIIAPHLVRLVSGPGHARLLPLTALVGGVMMTLADLVARMAIAPAELPIGLITTFIGAPVFIALLVRRRWQAW